MINYIVPGKDRNVPFFTGDWIAGFRGFKSKGHQRSQLAFQVGKFTSPTGC